MLLALSGLLVGCTRYVEVAPDVVVVDGARHGSVHTVNYGPLWPTYWWAWGGAAPGWPYHAGYDRGWIGWSPYAHRYTSLYYPRYGWSPAWRSHWYYWHYGMVSREPWVYEPPFNDVSPGAPGGQTLPGPWPGAVYGGLEPVVGLSPGWQDTAGGAGPATFEERWFGRERSVSGVSALERRVQATGVLDPAAGMVVRSRSGGKPGLSRTQPVSRPSRPTSVRAPRAPRPATRSAQPSRGLSTRRTTNRARNLTPER